MASVNAGSVYFIDQPIKINDPMDAQRPILCVSSLLSLRHPTPSRLLVNDSLAQLEPCQNYE
nr:hypothetical protein [Klebsiella pneumoniae subsp. pneumoniae]